VSVKIILRLEIQKERISKREMKVTAYEDIFRCHLSIHDLFMPPASASLHPGGRGNLQVALLTAGRNQKARPSYQVNRQTKARRDLFQFSKMNKK
jgi:hypothetical protein